MFKNINKRIHILNLLSFLILVFAIIIPLMPIKWESKRINAVFSLKNNLCYEICNQIKRAKKSIVISIMSLDDTHVFREIALASLRGVDVFIVVGKPIKKDLTVFINPKIKVIEIHLKSGVFHHKILVVDEKITIIGSANLTKKSLHTDINDLLILKSKKLSKFVSSYIRNIYKLHNRHNACFQGKIKDNFGVKRNIVWLFMPLKNDLFFRSYYSKFFNKDNKVICFEFTDNKISGISGDNSEFIINKSKNSIVDGRAIYNKSKKKIVHSKLSFNDEVISTGSVNYSKNGIKNNCEAVVFLEADIYDLKYFDFFKETKKYIEKQNN